MFRLLKKAAFGAALLGVGTYLWFGTPAGSYGRTVYGETVRWIYGQVPLDFQIARAKQLLKETDPAIKSTIKGIAEERVRIAKLEKEVVALNQQLSTETGSMLALKTELQRDGKLQRVNFNGRNWDRKVAEKELVRKFEFCKATTETVKLKEKVIAARQEGLIAAEQKHDKLQSLRKQFEAQIEQLETQYKQLQVKEMAQNIRIDDTKLTELKECLDSISDTMNVEEEFSKMNASTMPTKEGDEVNFTDVISGIEKQFGKDQAPAPKGTSL